MTTFLYQLILLLPSLVFLFISLNMKKKKLTRNYFPFVSVISWTWKGGNIIERKIKNFLSLNYPGKYEVIIVDNASEDETKEICEKYAKKGLIKFYRTKRPYDRKAYGLDEAIKKIAKGEILAMTDPDGVCEKDWLLKLVQPFKDSKVGAVIGLTHCGNFYENLFTRFRAIEDEWVYVISPLGRNFGRSFHLVCGANYAVRKKALEQVGYHGKKTLGEDLELTLKLYYKGWEVEVADANVWQEEVSSIREYERQRLRWIDSTIRAFKIYRKKFNKIYKQRPLGVFLYFLSNSLTTFSLFYFLLIFLGFIKSWLLIPGVFGFFVINLSVIIGLAKEKRNHLIKFVPLFLIVDSLLLWYCALKRWVIVNLQKKKIVWKVLSDRYYHKGSKIVKK